MVKIVIRQGKLSDVKYMMQLNEKNLSENYEINFWIETFMKYKRHCFVATFANEIIGYIFTDDRTIISFAIDKKFRNFGIGKQLMAHCLNTFTLDVDLHVRKTNDSARNLYKNFGFNDKELVANYYLDEDAYEMVHVYEGTKYIEKNKINIQIK